MKVAGARPALASKNKNHRWRWAETRNCFWWIQFLFSSSSCTIQARMQHSGESRIWTDNQPNLRFPRGLPNTHIHLERLQCAKWAPCATTDTRYGEPKDTKVLRSLQIRAGKILKCKYKNTLKAFSRVCSEQDFEKLSFWYKTCLWVTLQGEKDSYLK